jgi:hypothetical protein
MELEIVHSGNGTALETHQLAAYPEDGEGKWD